MTFLESIQSGKPFASKKFGNIKRYAYIEWIDLPIRCLFEDGYECSFTQEGHYFQEKKSDYDLYLLPESVETHANIYPDGGIFNYKDLDQANRSARSKRLAIIKITITGTEVTAEVLPV